MKLLIYHMDESKRKMVTTVCRILKVSIREITPAETGETLGALAGLPGYSLSGQSAAAVPDQEVMVLCRFRQKQLDAFLAKLRAMGVPQTGIKAILTDANKDWSFARLLNELLAEHAQFSQK